VTGQFTGAADLTGVRGWVEAPVKTLKTGNDKRDKDLNKSMESEKFPAIRFDLSGLTRSGGTADSATVTLHGSLTLHGVTHTVDLPAIIRLTPSEAQVRTDFPVNLKDYHIGGLSKLLGMLKMDEKIQVHTDLVFRLADS
jgi:polyisoprenoid-binding protein YceI